MLRSLLLATLVGCVPGFHVDAEVRAPQPVANASVSMTCPQVFKAEGLSLLGTTDARGQLAFDEHWAGRWIHDGCALVVERAGYVAQRIPVETVCRAYQHGHCIRAVVVAQLTPAR
jgi:hypothetical protein